MFNENLGISEVVTKLLIKADEDKIKELIKKEIDKKDKTIIFVDSLNMKIDGLIGGLIKVVYGAVAIKGDDKQDEINASINELIIQSVFLQKIDENNIVELTKMMTKNDLEKLDITEKDIAKALADKYNTDVAKVKFNW